MSIFSRFTNKNSIKGRAKRIVAESQASAERQFGPVRDIALIIITASKKCADGIKPFNEEPDKKKRQYNEICIFNEAVFFFMHLCMRSAVGSLTELEVRRLQEYIGPMVAEITVDTYCQHWPEDIKVKLRREFFQNLNNAEHQYADCSRFDSSADREDLHNAILTRLITSLVDQLLGLLGLESNDVAQSAAIKIVLDAYIDAKFDEPLERFKQHSMDLPPHREIRQNSQTDS